MLDLDALESLLRQINEDERSERHNFAHDGRVAFIDAATALIDELRALRAYRDEAESNKPTVQALLNLGELARSDAATLTARFRDLQAEVAAVIERFGYIGEEQTLMQVVEEIFSNGDQGWIFAHKLQKANKPEPISGKHQNGDRWLVYEPEGYGWQVGSYLQGYWMRPADNRFIASTPTFACPLPEFPESACDY